MPNRLLYISILVERKLFHCHAFRQIAGLVDVGAFLDGRQIGQNLDGQAIKDRGRDTVDRRQFDDMLGEVAQFGDPRRVRQQDPAPPRATTSRALLAVLSNKRSDGATNTTGTLSSISAIGPCFISPAAQPSAWR